ncbi:MAG: hypothetical protein QOI02_784 [Actinomycetota bacterium]|jgi:hypothetical protein|nr:hypothetical protein [Actinomycetota bacterium]
MTDAQQRPPRTTLFWRTAITITIGVDLVLIGILSFVPGNHGIGSYNPCANGAVAGAKCGEVTTIGTGAWILIVLGLIVGGYFLYRAIRSWRAETATDRA